MAWMSVGGGEKGGEEFNTTPTPLSLHTLTFTYGISPRSKNKMETQKK